MDTNVFSRVGGLALRKNAPTRYWIPRDFSWYPRQGGMDTASFLEKERNLMDTVTSPLGPRPKLGAMAQEVLSEPYLFSAVAALVGGLNDSRVRGREPANEAGADAVLTRFRQWLSAEPTAGGSGELCWYSA